MPSMLNRAFVALSLFVVSSGCDSLSGETCEQMHFATIDAENVTDVRLHKTNSSETVENEITRLTDNGSILNVLVFLKSRTKWRASPFGVPVGRYRVVFWGDDERLGSVSIGEEFLVGQGCGYFFSSDASSDEIKEFARMLGVQEPLDFEF